MSPTPFCSHKLSLTRFLTDGSIGVARMQLLWTLIGGWCLLPAWVLIGSAQRDG
jgi:hypothetical protein